MPYFEAKSTFEGEEDLGEGCSPRYEYDNEDLPTDDKICDSSTFFERTLWPIWECTSCHETECIEDVESFNDHLHQMDEYNIIQDQILKHMEESIS